MTVVSKDVLERWLKLELGQVHDSLVSAPLPLSKLLEMDRPVAQTRAGDAHEFDPAILEDLAAPLDDATRDKLKLPITIRFDRQAMGNCYIQDPTAIEALKALEEAHVSVRDGKLWMSKPLAMDLAKRYRTCFQFVLG